MERRAELYTDLTGMLGIALMDLMLNFDAKEIEELVIPATRTMDEFFDERSVDDLTRLSVSITILMARMHHAQHALGIAVPNPITTMNTINEAIDTAENNGTVN